MPGPPQTVTFDQPIAAPQTVTFDAPEDSLKTGAGMIEKAQGQARNAISKPLVQAAAQTTPTGESLGGRMPTDPDEIAARRTTENKIARGAEIGAGVLGAATPALDAQAALPLALKAGRSIIGMGAGGYVGGRAGRSIGEMVDHPELGQWIGATAGGFVGGGVAGGLERNPATSLQSFRGEPGSIRPLPLGIQRVIPEWMVPKGERGSPTNPGWFVNIPSRAPRTALPPAAEDPLAIALREGRAARIPTTMPKLPGRQADADQLALAIREGRAAKIPTKMPARVGTANPQEALGEFMNRGYRSAIEPRRAPVISASENLPEQRPSGSEGRPATWTNEDVNRLARQGNRDAIAQKIRRGMPLSDNERYIMGSADYPRAVFNPREVTRFDPEGKPIRNMARTQISNRARLALPEPKPEQ